MAALAFCAPVAARADPRRSPRGKSRRTRGTPRVAISSEKQTPAGIEISAKTGTNVVEHDPQSSEPEKPKPTHTSTRTLTVSAATLATLAACAPDPAYAREVVVQLPEFQSLDALSDFGNIDPAVLARFTLSNPPAAVAASVAAYVVIPKAAKVLTKYVLIPGVVVAVVFVVAENPSASASAFSSAINEAAAHPTETSVIIITLAALALSPYILLAALVALILSGAQVLPDAVPKKFVPERVRQAGEFVERTQRKVEPGVQKAKGAVTSVKNASSQAAKEKAQKASAAAQKKEAELVASEATHAARLAKREEATRVRAEQAAAAIDGVEERAAALRAKAEKEAAAAAAVAVAAVEVTADGAASTTRCATRETNELRAQCVDEQRAERKNTEARRTAERKEQAERLRADSAKRARELPKLERGVD